MAAITTIANIINRGCAIPFSLLLILIFGALYITLMILMVGLVWKVVNKTTATTQPPFNE
jgi:hypothetical protein